ncbi:hypothetical protein AB0C34_15020 [Nocardia sp. NPDC049220]
MIDDVPQSRAVDDGAVPVDVLVVRCRCADLLLISSCLRYS